MREVGWLTTEQLQERGGRVLRTRRSDYHGASGGFVTLADVLTPAGALVTLVECRHGDHPTHWHLCHE